MELFSQEDFGGSGPSRAIWVPGSHLYTLVPKTCHYEDIWRHHPSQGLQLSHDS